MYCALFDAAQYCFWFVVYYNKDYKTLHLKLNKIIITSVRRAVLFLKVKYYMKTMQCDLCDYKAQGETFEGWMNALKPHYASVHADVMTNTAKIEDAMSAWIALNSARFEALQSDSQSFASSVSQVNPQINPQNTQSSAEKLGRFQASKLLIRESFRLLKQDKEMMLFPILSVIMDLILFGILGVIFFIAVLHGDIKSLETSSGGGSQGVIILLMFVAYFGMSFINTFFLSGLMTIAYGRINGQDLTVLDGFNHAVSRIGKICIWALISATIGIILRTISERSEMVGKIVAGLLGAAWNILAFFIVPILITRDLSVKDSLKQSGMTIKKIWGETAIVNIGVGLIFGLLYVIGIIVFIVTIFSFWNQENSLSLLSISVGLLILYMAVLAIIASTLEAIFRVVLYVYASTGIAPQGFSKALIEQAFIAKK